MKFAAVIFPEATTVAVPTLPVTVAAFATSVATDTLPVTVAEFKVALPCCIPTAVPPAVFRKVLKEPVVFSRMKYVFSCAGNTTVTFAVNVPAISSVAFLD